MIRRPAALLAAVALAAVVAALAFHWWDRYVEDQLGRWAVGELPRRTDGAYHLVLGDLSFRPLAGSISFDSAIVATDTARNRRRETPLPILEGRAHGCRVFGLDLPRLLFRRSFVARGLGCDRVVARIALASRSREDQRPGSDSTAAEAQLRELARPLGLSSFRIAEVSLPALSFTLTRPGSHGGTSILLEHARFEAKDLMFDPTPTSEDRRTFSADQARLRGTGLVLRRDTLTEITIAGVDAGLTDSTLRLAGARHEPSVPENEWLRKVRVRRDRIRFELDSLRARGVAYRTFVATGDIGIRALELDGARLDVLTDKRIPRGRPSRHRTPQQVAVEPGVALRLDSVIVSGGAIVYREREPESERPGRVSFDAVRATILDLHLPPRGKPLRIAAGARLMNEGLLTVKASVPLDAPDFRYELSGKVGMMSAASFNQFLGENESFEFEEGRVEGIAFRQTARSGRATTTLTPRYRDLSVEPTGEGGGLVGSVARAVEEFIADAFVVRSRNPDEDGDNLRTARTVRHYHPAQSWTQFLWFGLRDGLKETVKE
ncbi:MAG TPA: hypothetical protein VM094_08665 [Gemmatimonadales bacterium]|nr:hypothetical protein [Gemmatimonadales bacterium]